MSWSVLIRFTYQPKIEIYQMKILDFTCPSWNLTNKNGGFPAQQSNYDAHAKCTTLGIYPIPQKGGAVDGKNIYQWLIFQSRLTQRRVTTRRGTASWRRSGLKKTGFHPNGVRSNKIWIYSLVNRHSELENGHRHSGFSQWKWLFSIVMFNYRRVKHH